MKNEENKIKALNLEESGNSTRSLLGFGFGFGFALAATGALALLLLIGRIGVVA